MSGHTLLPWAVRRMGDDCFVQAKRLKPEHPYDIEIIGDDVNEELYPVEQKMADAKFIVRAVNSHDDLLDACKWFMEKVDDNTLVRDISRDGESGFHIRMLKFVAGLDEAMTAIKKATPPS